MTRIDQILPAIAVAILTFATACPSAHAQDPTPVSVTSPANCVTNFSANFDALANRFAAMFPDAVVPDFDSIASDQMGLFEDLSGLSFNDVGQVADPMSLEDNVFSYYIYDEPGGPVSRAEFAFDDSENTIETLGRRLLTDGAIGINSAEFFDDGDPVHDSPHPLVGEIRAREAFIRGLLFSEFFGAPPNGPGSYAWQDSPYVAPSVLDLANIYALCPEPRSFDEQAARALLDEAGWTFDDGGSQPTCVNCEPYFHSGDPANRLTSIQDDLDVGTFQLFIRMTSSPDQDIDLALYDVAGRLIRQWAAVPPIECSGADECIHEVGPIRNVDWTRTEGTLFSAWQVATGTIARAGLPIINQGLGLTVQGSVDIRIVPRHSHDSQLILISDFVSGLGGRIGATFTYPGEGMPTFVGDPPDFLVRNIVRIDEIPGLNPLFGAPGTTASDSVITRYTLEQTRAALARLEAEEDPAERVALYGEARDTLFDEAPNLFERTHSTWLSNEALAGSGHVELYDIFGRVPFVGNSLRTTDDWNTDSSPNPPRVPAVSKPLAGSPQPSAFIDITRRAGMDVHVVDLDAGSHDRRIPFLGGAWTARGHTILDDFNGNGAFESVVVATRNSDLAIIAQVRDSATGARLANIYFLGTDFLPWRVTTVPDLDGNGTDEIVVLAIRRSDQAIITQIRDGQTGNLIGNRYYLGSAFQPQRMIVLPDADGDSVPEIGVLAIRSIDRRFVVQIKNATGPSGTRNLWFLGPQYFPLFMTGTPDSDDDGNPEIAVLAIRLSDNRFVVQYRNANGAPAPRNRWYLNGDYTPVRIITLPDSDADGMPELAVLAWRADLDGRMVVQVRNTNGAPRPRDLWYWGYGHIPMNIVAYDDATAGGGVRMGVISRYMGDLRYRMEMRDLRGPAAKQQFLLTE